MMNTHENYWGFIKFSVDDDTRVVAGQIVADGMNVAGVNVAMSYTGTGGNKVKQALKTDINGCFIDDVNRAIGELLIVAETQLVSPAGTPVHISARRIQTTPFNGVLFKTEDALHYLVTESGDYLLC